MTDDELLDTLDLLGVRLIVTDLPSDRDGEYEHDLRVIRLRPGMARRLHRSVLAHECAHAVHRDVPLRDPHHIERQESRADEWAARALISVDDYARAETIHGGHVQAMAVELDVTVDLVRAFQRTLLQSRAWAVAAAETRVPG